jgi:phage baseplate assembly protein W
MTVNIDFPFRVGGNGRTAVTDDADHIRDLIEQVLFTMPGERVNMPTFGSSLSRMLFAPNNTAAGPGLQLAVQAALMQWLGDRIVVTSVLVDIEDSTVTVTVQYVVNATQQTNTVELTNHA